MKDMTATNRKSSLIQFEYTAPQLLNFKQILSYTLQQFINNLLDISQNSHSEKFSHISSVVLMSERLKIEMSKGWFGLEILLHNSDKTTYRKHIDLVNVTHLGNCV